MLKKIVALSIIVLLTLPVVSFAGDVTVPCTGAKHAQITVSPEIGGNGELLVRAFEPRVIAAKCVDQPGNDVYILAMPGKPKFNSLEDVQAFLRHIDQGGFTATKKARDNS